MGTLITYDIKTGTATQEDFSPAPISIDTLKELQKQKIRDSFQLESMKPILDPLGGTHYYHGGYEAGQRIDGARRLTEKRGRPIVNIHDTDNQPHQVNAIQCLEIAMSIGDKYQADFEKKQQLMLAIDAATTQEEVQAIVW